MATDVPQPAELNGAVENHLPVYIISFKVTNYKSFDSAQLTLKPGFNLIVGQNNAGKTALLESLSLNFPNKPHRSSKTLQRKPIEPQVPSSVDFSLLVSRDELKRIIFHNHMNFYLPAPAPDSDFARSHGFTNRNTEGLHTLANWFLDQAEFTIKIRRDGSGNWSAPTHPSFGLYIVSDAALARYDVHPDGTFHSQGMTSVAYNDGEIGIVLARGFGSRIYFFLAERRIAPCAVGGSVELKPDASNLAEVLINLQNNNPSVFNQYIALVQRVLPQIQAISIRNLHPQMLEVMIWTVPPDTGTDDLAIELRESGTGIGQILALLYLVHTSKDPKLIIIDEPQSFLHPGAARKLTEILKGYQQHQFIVATHAPSVIVAANPKTITLVRHKENISTLETIDASEAGQLRIYLAEIGSRLSDVFGADNVLWVEGKTEELCFPMILERIAGRSLMGTAIVGVRSTDELKGTDANAFFDIYERLTKTSSLLPAAIGFVFDTECLTPQKQSDLQRRREEPVKFLPKRMYENYLLNAEAVAAVLNEAVSNRGAPVTAEDVQKIIEKAAQEEKYYCLSDKKQKPGIDRLDAAKLLEGIFSELSECRVSYSKVVHSVALTKWLLDNSKQDVLGELSALLLEVLDSGS